MATRALLILPNYAVLRVVGRLSCLRGTKSLSTRRSYHLSSRRSSYRTELPLSCFGTPTRITLCRRGFFIQATDNPASIEPPLIESMEKKIKEQLSAESVIVKDAYGDGRHISIEVISTAFEGKSAVNRQRMVYKAIWEELQDTVHAVDQMTTRTPEEASGKQSHCHHEEEKALKILSALQTWQVYKGDSSDSGDVVFSAAQFRTDEVDVNLGNKREKNSWDFKAVGSWLERSCIIYNHHSTAIAQVQRKHKFRCVLKGEDTLSVTAGPNVDYSFVVALVVILDRINDGMDD